MRFDDADQRRLKRFNDNRYPYENKINAQPKGKVSIIKLRYKQRTKNRADNGRKGELFERHKVDIIHAPMRNGRRASSKNLSHVNSCA